MLKYTLFIITSFFLVKTAECQHRDTTIVYYKSTPKGKHQVYNLESADFFRVVLPPDSADSRVNVREFYKNGTPKFIGKYDPIDSTTASESLSGDCISYYPNGKKASICQYTMGQKQGNEYLFYPNGTIYCYKKNTSLDGKYSRYSSNALETKNWECYDANGIIVCKDGNGQWIEYDKDFKNILSTGPVKNGYMDGEWHYNSDADSIKYICKYKKGVLVSGIGYDKTGVAYPFTKKAEWANYKGGVLTFIKAFKNHLTLPKSLDGKKLSIDTVHISFVVEKDGHTDQFETLGNVDPDLNKALAEAITKCNDWLPGKYYGVPFREGIILPLTFLHGYNDNYKDSAYKEEVSFKERVLGF